MPSVLLSRPEVGEPKRPRPKPLTRLIVAAVLAFGIPLVGGVGVAGGWAWYRFGSPSAAAAFLRGQSFALDPPSVELGTVTPFEKRVVSVRAVNLTGRAIAVNGARSDCTQRDGCVLWLGEFPVSIEPWGTRSLALEYRSSGPAGPGPVHVVTEVYTEIGDFEIPLNGKRSAATNPNDSHHGG